MCSIAFTTLHLILMIPSYHHPPLSSPSQFPHPQEKSLSRADSGIQVDEVRGGLLHSLDVLFVVSVRSHNSLLLVDVILCEWECTEIVIILICNYPDLHWFYQDEVWVCILHCLSCFFHWAIVILYELNACVKCITEDLAQVILHSKIAIWRYAVRSGVAEQ